MERTSEGLRAFCASTMILVSLVAATACGIEELDEEQCYRPSARVTDFSRGCHLATRERVSECGWEPTNEQSAGTCLYHPTRNVTIWLDPPVAQFPGPWITCSDDAAPAHVREAGFLSIPTCE